MQLVFLLFLVPLFAADRPIEKIIKDEESPLSEFSTEWNDPKYLVCNTATDVEYMNEDEKMVIYILNLARFNPKLFASTVVKQYPEFDNNDYLNTNSYYLSLLKKMENLKPMGLLQPDKACYSSAECHATYLGTTGKVGHDRSGKCKKTLYYNGECCDYGNKEPVDIVLSLLIDYGVPSLGHRSICLGSYSWIGVSIKPHKKWETNAVLDFHF